MCVCAKEELLCYLSVLSVAELTVSINLLYCKFFRFNFLNVTVFHVML